MLLLLSFGAITSYAALIGRPSPTADAIVVLGAGMDADGTLHREGVARVMQGVALYQAGAAPQIHFSGGLASPGGPGGGDQMAAVARSQGVPESAITTENRSLSTLQNALFSKPMLANANSVILVSEAFHLPRAAASFWWMGYDNINTVHSDRFRRTQSGGISLRMLGRETLAVWFNLARATLWSITGATRDDWLE